MERENLARRRVAACVGWPGRDDLDLACVRRHLAGHSPASGPDPHSGAGGAARTARRP